MANDSYQDIEDNSMEECNLQRYADCLAALKECIERGVSSESMAILRFEMGISAADYLALQDAVIAQLKAESIAAMTKKKPPTTNQKHGIDSWVHSNE